MWRPEGWEKQKYSNEGSEWIVMEKGDAYEAGADAILEALKKEALVRRITLPANSEAVNDLSDFELTKSGWLVFIPEEKL